MLKVILDTDIGTDVDDILALSLLLASPEVELLGVTAAYGDTRLRAKLVHQVLAHAGRAGQVPILAGTPETLSGTRDIFWVGHEGKSTHAGRVSDDVITSSTAEDFIVDTVARHPGEVNIVAIAPLGNIARAILKAPDVMRGVRRLYVMGGVFDHRDLTFPAGEHNVLCDPEAARVVFDSSLPITLFPLDVTTRTRLGPAEIRTLGQSGAPLARLLHQELLAWMPFIQERHDRDYTHMHDPLTAAALIDASIVTRSMCTAIGVECAGSVALGVTVPSHGGRVPNVEVVLDVDVARFQALFMSRLLDLAGAAVGKEA